MLNKKILVKILATSVAVMMAVTPVTAFAEGGKEIEAYDGDKKEDLGDVKADEQGVDAVAIRAGGHTAEVTTGNIESAETNGLYTWAEHNAEIDVDVTGDINTPAATSTGEERAASGVTTNVWYGSKNDINVNGNIISGYEGITVNTSDYDNGRKDEGDYGDSRTDIMVNGNITADKSAINATASLGGENHIEVNGDVTGFAKGGDDPERDDAVIWIQATDSDSRNDVFVKGDVTGDRIGVWVVVPAENTGYPENNVVIDGTLSANVAAVQVDDRLEEGKFKNTITVWKIETPGFTAAKWETIGQDEENPQFNLVEDEEIEKNIQYIIRVKQNDNATLTATDENGNALATVTGAGGSVLDYAKEGDKVLIKIDVAHGYRIEAVYGDEGREIELVKDASGNYYINVPRNGGVSFSVRLLKLESDAHNEEGNNTPAQATGQVVRIPVKVTGFPDGTYAVLSEQGPAAKAILAAAIPAGFLEGFSFNLITNDKAETTLKKGSFTMTIPKEIQKTGRTFAIIGLDKNGKTFVLPDIDTDPDTITVSVDLEGYAFELIYSD